MVLCPFQLHNNKILAKLRFKCKLEKTKLEGIETEKQQQNKINRHDAKMWAPELIIIFKGYQGPQLVNWL